MSKKLPKVIRMAVNRKAFLLARQAYPTLRRDLEKKALSLLRMPGTTAEVVIRTLELDIDDNAPACTKV